MRFLKKVFLLSLVGLAGWGIYSAGQSNLFSFLDSESEEQAQLAKKDRAVKPKSFFRKVKDVMPAPVKEYDYTFFETLDDVNLDIFAGRHDLLDREGFHKAGPHDDVAGHPVGLLGENNLRRSYGECIRHSA